MKIQPTARLLVIDDEANILRFLTRALEKRGYEVHPVMESQEALEKLTVIQPDLVITDLVMPDMSGIELLKRIKAYNPEINVVVITAHASLDTAISAIRGGASDYLVKPFQIEELCSVVKRSLSSKRIIYGEGGNDVFEKRYDFRNLIGTSQKMKEIHALIQRVAANDATVLITGESGTGKELVARSIHYNSKRRAKPFVSINCAALPENLMESELFGHEKGSFTGATSTKMGLLELAHEGTFLFDEIAEIPLQVQAKLLRVLQEKELRHVGGLRDIKVDVRLVAATSKDLRSQVQKGLFREDLFYRLNVVPIHLPPLRERREDIPLLIAHFLEYYSQKHNLKTIMRIEEAAVKHMTEVSDWPGNIRELENAVERAILFSDNGVIQEDQILKVASEHSRETPGSVLPSNGSRNLKTETEGFEKRLIENVLKETSGNKFRAARRLQISRQSLQYKIKKYQLE